MIHLLNMKFLIIFFIFSFFSLSYCFSVNPSYAEETDVKSSPAPSQIVDSHALFWPLSAGKTEGDPLYFLKLLKEQVWGWLIFDSTKKADYAVFLGTKRVLEAEKLQKENEIDFMIKTLRRADSQFSAAYKYAKEAVAKEKFSSGEVRRDRLINIKSLIGDLKTNSPGEAKLGLDAIREKADAILRDYLP